MIASDAFKETLKAEQACRAIAEGARRALPQAEIVSIPLADGGEGTLAALLSGRGRREDVDVTGPLGDPVSAEFGVMPDGRTAVVEMSAASGFELLPTERRDPLLATTYGTGQLIRAAWAALQNRGPVARTSGSETSHSNALGDSREASQKGPRIIVGAGGSATVDGGCGALQALGVCFLDKDGKIIREHICGETLSRIQRMDSSSVDPALRETAMVVACDVNNPLCGPEGAARVFAPQKGAAPAGVAILERNLAHLADLFERDLGMCVGDLPQAGAAGGLAAGLHAVFRAPLVSGASLVMDTLDFAGRAAGADLIITGEGCLDSTSPGGKVVGCVAEQARRGGIPVLAVVGATGRGWEQVASLLDGVYTLADQGVSVAQARADAAARLADVTEKAIRGRGIST